MRKVVVALLIAIPTAAAPYDMILVGDNVGGCFILSFSSPRAEWHPYWSEDPTDVHAVAAAPFERVFAAVRGPRIEIVELHADQSRTPFFSGFEGVVTAKQLVVDESGDVYVLTQATNPTIVALSSEGNLTATHPLPFTMQFWENGFDLAADQCTAFIGANGVIRRFNVCTGTPLPDFANVSVTDLAVLPDGGLLVSTADTELRRYDASGVLTDTIELEDGVNAFALRRGGFGALLQMGCDSGELRDVNLLTGESFRLDENTFVTQARSILVADSWTAAIGATTPEVPTLATWMLMAMAGLLATFALTRLR